MDAPRTLQARDRAGRASATRSILAMIAFGTLLLVTIGSVQAATVTVASVNFTFQPETRTISAGDVVRWTFAGDPHTVTSGSPGAPDGRFDSGIKDPGGSFQVTFNNAGTVEYFCQIHPEQMFGTIVVSGEPAPTPTPAASPTPTPTARPTARATARPTARPTAAPTQTATASPTEAATASPSATPTVAPVASASSEAPAASPIASSPEPSTSDAATPAATQPPGDGEAASALDPLPIVVVGLVVGLLVAGGTAYARRPRG